MDHSWVLNLLRVQSRFESWGSESGEAQIEDEAWVSKENIEKHFRRTS